MADLECSTFGTLAIWVGILAAFGGLILGYFRGPFGGHYLGTF